MKDFDKNKVLKVSVRRWIKPQLKQTVLDKEALGEREAHRQRVEEKGIKPELPPIIGFCSSEVVSEPVA